jgi:hypothetical protein
LGDDVLLILKKLIAALLTDFNAKRCNKEPKEWLVLRESTVEDNARDSNPGALRKSLRETWWPIIPPDNLAK